MIRDAALVMSLVGLAFAFLAAPWCLYFYSRARLEDAEAEVEEYELDVHSLDAANRELLRQLGAAGMAADYTELELVAWKKHRGARIEAAERGVEIIEDPHRARHVVRFHDGVGWNEVPVYGAEGAEQLRAALVRFGALERSE